jgi:cardiolipin synthase
VGTANMDFRSFELNFEVNAFVYDENLAKDLRAAYEHDITKSKQLTEESYANRPFL